MGVLNGLLMELDDCAFPLVKKVVATADPLEAFKVISGFPIYLVSSLFNT